MPANKNTLPPKAMPVIPPRSCRSVTSCCWVIPTVLNGSSEPNTRNGFRLIRGRISGANGGRMRCDWSILESGVKLLGLSGIYCSILVTHILTVYPAVSDSVVLLSLFPLIDIIWILLWYHRLLSFSSFTYRQCQFQWQTMETMRCCVLHNIWSCCVRRRADT